MYHRIEKEMQSFAKRNIRVYTTTEDFISDYTKVDIVKLENYKIIFQVFVLTLLSILLVFIVHKFLLTKITATKTQKLKNNLFNLSLK